MRVYELGKEGKPVILLLPGTFCDCYGNFESVIDLLKEDFHVLLVSYTGFLKEDTEDFVSILDEVNRIEQYIIENYAGHVDAIYGSSLGGSLLAHIVNRDKISCEDAILGSSDLDQSSPFVAFFKSKLVLAIAYPIIVSGKIERRLAKFMFRNNSKEQVDKLITVLGGKREWVSKLSCERQFKSDLTTVLPVNIQNEKTRVHIFYALKMGEKYLDRYQRHFMNPIIHRQDYKHEELLEFYPVKWVSEVKKIIENK